MLIWDLSFFNVNIAINFLLVLTLLHPNKVFLFFLAVPPSMQDFSYPTRDWTHDPCSGSLESEPLAHQGNPSHKFWYITFLFSFVSRHFLIFLVVSPLTHWLFKGVLFNFYIFLNFPVFILLFISTFIPLCLRDGIIINKSKLIRSHSWKLKGLELLKSFLGNKEW